MSFGSRELGENYEQVIAFYSEIDKYIEKNPEIRDFSAKFYDAVEERHFRIRKRLMAACRIFSIRSSSHPWYKDIEQKVVKLYPSWDSMKEKIIAGMEIDFPD